MKTHEVEIGILTQSVRLLTHDIDQNSDTIHQNFNTWNRSAFRNMAYVGIPIYGIHWISDA